jgi:hypothetical protein
VESEYTRRFEKLIRKFRRCQAKGISLRLTIAHGRQANLIA